MALFEEKRSSFIAWSFDVILSL